MTLEEKINQLRAAEKRLRKHLSEDEFGVVGRTAEAFGREADWLEELKRYRDLEAGAAVGAALQRRKI